MTDRPPPLVLDGALPFDEVASWADNESSRLRLAGEEGYLGMVYYVLVRSCGTEVGERTNCGAGREAAGVGCVVAGELDGAGVQGGEEGAGKGYFCHFVVLCFSGYATDGSGDITFLVFWGGSDNGGAGASTGKF